MRRLLLSAAAVLAIACSPAIAQSDQTNEVCPSGQINTAPAGSPQKCELDVTATTPAPEVVEDVGEAVKDVGEAAVDTGEAVVDTVTGAVKDIAD
jgi:hypothetical protein